VPMIGTASRPNFTLRRLGDAHATPETTFPGPFSRERVGDNTFHLQSAHMVERLVPKTLTRLQRRDSTTHLRANVLGTTRSTSKAHTGWSGLSPRRSRDSRDDIPRPIFARTCWGQHAPPPKRTPKKPPRGCPGRHKAEMIIRFCSCQPRIILSVLRERR
jgi:hypothetical protein